MSAEPSNSQSQKSESSRSSFKRPVAANISRLHEFMDHDGLSAIVARSGENFTYLSGIAYPGTLARHLDIVSSPRGVLIFWPRRSEPVIILNKYAEGLTRQDSWVRRIEVYEAYSESPYERLANVIKEAGLDREKIGFEKNYVTALQWEELQRVLPACQFVDCTAIMDRVRWIKTPGEIELLKNGADLLDDAYLEVFPTIRPGDTEREVHARLLYSCIRRGAGWAHGILNSSSNLVLYGGESDKAFQRGDVVRTDYAAYLRGYPGHQSRNAVLGAPTAEQEREYSFVRDTHRRTIDKCRPGVRAGDLFEFVAEEYLKHGWKYAVGLIGHSVGPWMHQQEPILVRGSQIILEDGMVLALEPHKEYWHIQDMVVIRKDGPQLISAKFNTDKPFVVG